MPVFDVRTMTEALDCGGVRLPGSGRARHQS